LAPTSTLSRLSKTARLPASTTMPSPGTGPPSRTAPPAVDQTRPQRPSGCPCAKPGLSPIVSPARRPVPPPAEPPSARGRSSYGHASMAGKPKAGQGRHKVTETPMVRPSLNWSTGQRYNIKHFEMLQGSHKISQHKLDLCQYKSAMAPSLPRSSSTCGIMPGQFVCKRPIVDTHHPSGGPTESCGYRSQTAPYCVASRLAPRVGRVSSTTLTAWTA